MKSLFDRPSRWLSIPAFLLIIGFLGWGYYSQSASVTESERTVFMMDTVVQIRAVGPQAEAAVDEAVKEMQRVERMFSRFDEDSAVDRINRAAGTWISVPEEVIALIAKGVEYGHLTEGAFDITIGALMDLWGFNTESPSMPSQDELHTALQTLLFSEVELNYMTNQVRIPSESVLDLGGIAKGYAVDRGRRVLQTRGVTHSIINAGGDIATIGGRPDGRPWRVGIQDPTDSASLLAVVEITDMTIVTSGDYERFFELDGVRFHHILDTKTGFPAEGLRSVTVIAPDAAAGDALSTAIFVLGWEKGQELVQQLDDVEALLVNAEGENWVSLGLIDSVTFR